jgi:hypothetical protein
MRQVMEDHSDYLAVLFDRWSSSDDVEERRNAQMVVGYMQLHNMRNGNGGNNEEIVPKNAPASIHALLNANQRSKIQRLASSFHSKYAVDFYCRQNWPKFDGFMVHINEVKPNSTGTGFSDESLKKRETTQICVLGASQEALDRFQAAMNPQIDEASYSYFVTNNVAEFCEKLREGENDEEAEDDDE